MTLDSSTIQFRDRAQNDSSVYPITKQSAVMDASCNQDLTQYFTEYNVSMHRTNSTSGSARRDTSVFILSEAIAHVPTEYRHGGLKLIFNTSSSSSSAAFDHVAQYMLDSNVWTTTASKWKQIDSSKLDSIEGEIGDVAFATSQKVNTVRIVNDTSTGGANNVLSAEQGKQLRSDLTQLDQDVNGLNDINLYVSSANKWQVSTSHIYLGYVVPVKQNDVIYAKWKDLYTVRGIFSTYPVKGEDVVNLLSSFYPIELEETINVSSDGYFVFWTIYSDINHTPQILTLNDKDVLSMIVDVRTLIANNKEQIKQNIESISELSDEVSALIDETTFYDETVINTPSSNFVIGGIRAVNGIGEPITLTTSTAYRYYVYGGNAGESIIPGQIYKLKLLNSVSTINYPWLVIFTKSIEGSDKIVSYLAANNYDQQYHTYDDIVVPEDADKMYFMWYYTVSAIPTLTLKTPISIQQRIDDIEDEMKVLNPEIQQSQQDWMEWESNWFIKEAIMNQLYGGSGETTPYTAWKTAASAHTGIGFRMAIISDTHGSGAYSWLNIRQGNRNASSCLRSIKVFNDIMNENGFCQCAMHGGDLSCDYGTSRKRDLDYMYDIVRKFHWIRQTPFFITKGNHDENNNPYVQVNDYTKLDWDNTTYYTRSFSTFTATTKSTWDGSPLFVSKTELVSDREFCDTIQNWMSPSGKVYGPGAYYYYDFDTQKIRIIVANSFPIKDNYTNGEAEEYAWFGQTALDLSSKDNPLDWQVIVIRHTECSSQANLVNCLLAFKNGTTWTYGSGQSAITVDYGTLNGGGCTVIAHIHGHEHVNNIANNTGIMDIGVNWANVTLNNLGDATYYGLNIFSFDLESHIIYQDEISGLRIEYDYENNLIRLPIGTRINLSRNGMGDIVPASSDTSIINVGGTGAGAYAVGVATGLADVTITVGQNTKTYHFRVID